MIGNEYLRKLYAHTDEDTAINQLLELLKSRDKEFIDSLDSSIDIERCNKKELTFLIKVSALIDYYLQLYDLEVPDWLRDERLIFDKPYFHPKRLSDFEKVKSQYTNPAPFKVRNVYFKLDGIQRI